MSPITNLPKFYLNPFNIIVFLYCLNSSFLSSFKSKQIFALTKQEYQYQNDNLIVRLALVSGKLDKSNLNIRTSPHNFNQDEHI